MSKALKPWMLPQLTDAEVDRLARKLNKQRDKDTRLSAAAQAELDALPSHQSMKVLRRISDLGQAS